MYIMNDILCDSLWYVNNCLDWDVDVDSRQKDIIEKQGQTIGQAHDNVRFSSI